MYWGGLRGAISLALVLGISSDLFGAAVATELRVMTFGVVLFTLLGQGITIERLIRRLKLSDKPPQRTEQQRRQALLYAKWAGRRELERLRQDGILFRDIWEAMGEVYDKEIDHNKATLRAHLRDYPELEQEMYLQAREETLKAEKRAISDAARRGLISEEVQEELSRELNNRSAALELIKANRSLDGKESEQ
jgi:CPA1 family monovalent cation:H+ antiporter